MDVIFCALCAKKQVDYVFLCVDQKQVRARLVGIMQKLHSQSVGHEADFDCMAENVDSLDPFSTEMMGGTRSTPLLSCYSARRTADCR